MKRLSCILLALGLVLSLVVPVAPASADYQSQSNFWQWLASNGGVPQKVLGYVTGDAVCPDSQDGKHHASVASLDRGAGHFTCTCAYCGETFNATYSDISNAYTDTVDEMEFKSLENGGLIWQPTTDDFINTEVHVGYGYGNAFSCSLSSLPYEADGGVISGSTDHYKRFITGGTTIDVHQNWYQQTATRILLRGDNKVTAPVDGLYYKLESESSVYGTQGSNMYQNSVVFPVSDSPELVFAGGLVSVGSRDVEARDGYCRNLSGRLEIPAFRIEEFDFGDNPDPLLTPSFRAITGDYSVVGDNNEVFHHEETIFNEDNSTFYNPVTDTSTNITNWNYDYSTRTYSMTDENGEEKSLTYGDDNIVINDGGNTFNLYYGDVSQSGSGESGSGESGSGESGTGLIAQVGQLLGTLVSGLLGGITAFLSAILSALTNLVEVIGEGFNGILEAVLGWFAELPQLFHGFLEFLTAVFGYMPAQILSMLSFGVAAVVFVGILKALRR